MVFFKKVWFNRLVKHRAHLSQWLLHARTITTIRIQLIQDRLLRILQQVHLIRVHHDQLLHTRAQRIQDLQEQRPLHTQVLRVLHQVTVRHRLQDRPQRNLQRHHIVLRLHLDRLLHDQPLLQALLQGQLHQVKDLDAKQDVEQDVTQGSSKEENSFASISFNVQCAIRFCAK